MELYTINTGFFKLDGGAMFGVVPKALWNKLNPADENNLCTWAMRCLLVIDGDRKILIDTGIGDKQDEKFFKHYYLHGNESLLSSLEAKGLRPEDITDVILTHLHFDHVGGAVKIENDQLTPTFPKATYWTNEAHWEWAINPNPREKASFFKENILPLKDSGQLKFIDKGSSPFENISFYYVDGHTEAQMLPIIRYKNKTIVYVADLLPSLAHIPIPYVMAYDMRPLLTLDEKQAFLTEAVENNYILYFEHDPTYECCDLAVTDKGIRANNTYLLSEIV